jgi:UDP-3-O-[3-hydroxymyristoyl] glucosamine N-acyltransferase
MTNKLVTTAGELASAIGAELSGDSSLELTGIAPAVAARPGDLTFAEKPSYLALAEQSAASAILVPPETATSSTKILLRVKNVRIALAQILEAYFVTPSPPPGVHSSAVVAASASIGAEVFIGPNCVIGEEVILGRGVVLLGGNHIGAGTRLGDQTKLHPNVVVYPGARIGARVVIHAGSVIGSDGYGYVFDAGRHRKMLQIGEIIIEDDVEIGANAAIDRGALGPTVIGAGTKIDNLVHLAHNVIIGRHCLIMGQVGFAGSTKLGDYGVIASQSGISGHLNLGAQTTVGAKSGVMRDTPPGSTILGIPARPDKEAKRQIVALTQLPQLIRRVRELEKKLGTGSPAADSD